MSRGKSKGGKKTRAVDDDVAIPQPSLAIGSVVTWQGLINAWQSRQQRLRGALQKANVLLERGDTGEPKCYHIGTSVLSPKHGLGLFATQIATRGQLIVSERPLLEHTGLVDAKGDLIQSAFDAFFSDIRNLPDADKKTLLRLSDSNVPDIRIISSSKQLNKELKASMTTDNATAQQLGSTLQQYQFSFESQHRTTHRLFRDLSFINHSCRPNVEATWMPATRTFDVRAIRRIQAGEEIAIARTSPYGMRAARRDRLGYDCLCDVCRLEGEAFRESEYRRAVLSDALLLLNKFRSEYFQDLPAKEVMDVTEKIAMVIRSDKKALLLPLLLEGERFFSTAKEEGLCDSTLEAMHEVLAVVHSSLSLLLQTLRPADTGSGDRLRNGRLTVEGVRRATADMIAGIWIDEDDDDASADRDAAAPFQGDFTGNTLSSMSHRIRQLKAVDDCMGSQHPRRRKLTDIIDEFFPQADREEARRQFGL